MNIWWMQLVHILPDKAVKSFQCFRIKKKEFFAFGSYEKFEKGK